MPDLPVDDTSQLILALAAQEAQQTESPLSRFGAPVPGLHSRARGGALKAVVRTWFQREGTSPIGAPGAGPGQPGTVFSPEEISGNYTDSVRHALQVSRPVAKRDSGSLTSRVLRKTWPR